MGVSSGLRLAVPAQPRVMYAAKDGGRQPLARWALVRARLETLPPTTTFIPQNSKQHAMADVEETTPTVTATEAPVEDAEDDENKVRTLALTDAQQVHGRSAIHHRL